MLNIGTEYSLHRLVSVGEGDCIGFCTDAPTTIEPEVRVRGGALPPLILLIMGNRKGHSPIEFKRSTRKRIRHELSVDHNNS